MSQFCLVKNELSLKNMENITLVEDNQDLISKAKLSFSEDREELIQVKYKGKSVDELCCEAQTNLLVENNKLEDSELYEFLMILFRNKLEFWFWYGSDYQDLDTLDDVNLFLNEIKKALLEPGCEIYFHWKPAHC